MARKYTITDVATDLGVSCSTVSRALSDAPGVSDKVRRRIMEYAKEIGYMPNSKVHKKEESSRIVALIIGDIRNPFYAELAFYIQSILNEHGYMMMVFNTEYCVDKEMEILEFLKRFRFDGAIMMTTQVEKINSELERMEIPVVLVNRNLNSFQGDMVLLDNFQAGYIAAMHLIELGHRRIGIVKGHMSSSASRQRYEGYCQAMRNYGYDIREDDIYYSDMKMKSGKLICQEFLQRDSRPTAMLIINDVTAMGFVSEYIARGYRVPEDLSVVSFDNTQFADWSRVPLTSIDQNVENMGKKAAEVMLNRIETPQTETKRFILTPELVVRMSTARYKKQ